MKSVRWKINIASVFGGVLLLLSIFLLGIDENKTFMRGYSENNGRNLDFLCNVCAWLLVLSSALLFMPLFFKLWKAMELFFGGYAAMNVSQILGFRQIARLDET